MPDSVDVTDIGINMNSVSEGMSCHWPNLALSGSSNKMSCHHKMKSHTYLPCNPDWSKSPLCGLTKSLHLNNNEIPKPIMTKATKKKTPTALPRSTTKKSKSASSKKSNEGNLKKARKGKGTGAQKGKLTDAHPVARTPDWKQRKSPSLQSTPSTVSSKSTTESKCAVSMMSTLALKTPPKKKKVKREQDVASNAIFSDTVDLDDAAMIDWTCKEGLEAAVEHHFDDHEDFEGLDHHDKVMLLCNKKFNPANIRPVLQGIMQDAGKDWRTLKLQKHRSMKRLASEFAKECVYIVNAKAELLESKSGTVPQNVIINEEKA